MRTSLRWWHISLILHIIIWAVVGIWVRITTNGHVTSRQILSTSGSLDPSSLIILSYVVPCLYPPFLIMRHVAPGKI
jgi:hypothetical protein